MKGCDHEYVLPQFSEAALHTKKSGASSSDVSRQWSGFFENIRNTFEILADEINEELGSHSNRRGGNQSLAENPSVHGFAAIYRSGIKPKNLATIFDYLFGSAELLRQSGKGLAGWVTKNGDIVMGGQPPTFDDIDDVDILRKFTDTIFEDDTEKRWTPKVRELLVMNLLLRYDQYIAVLQSHPFAKLVEPHPFNYDTKPEERYSCSSIEDNIFVNRVNQILERVSAKDENPSSDSEDDPEDMFAKWRKDTHRRQAFENTFSGWKKDARRAFVSRNGGGLPIQSWASYGVEPDVGFLMDTRTLIDHFNLLASTVQANHMELLRQRHVLNDIRQAFNVESRITSEFIVKKLFKMERSLRRLEEFQLPDLSDIIPHPPKNVLMFSVSSKCLPAKASLTETTVAFFLDDYRTGYELEQKSFMWNEQDPTTLKKIRNKFSLIKRAVRLTLFHADSFPLFSNNRTQYKKDISVIAKDAEDKIRVCLNFDDSVITRHKLEKQPGLKDLERRLKLPKNTPSDWEKFFRC